jgi:hypothetical protein
LSCTWTHSTHPNPIPPSLQHQSPFAPEDWA